MSTFAGTWPLLRLAWRRDRWVVIASVAALVLTAYSSMAATLELYPTDAEAAAGARVMADNPSITALYGPLPSLTAAAVGVLKTIMLGSLFTAFLLVFVDTMKELPATLIVRPFDFDTLAVRVHGLAADERLAEASTAALLIVVAGLLPVLALTRAMRRS